MICTIVPVTRCPWRQRWFFAAESRLGFFAVMLSYKHGTRGMVGRVGFSMLFLSVNFAKANPFGCYYV